MKGERGKRVKGTKIKQKQGQGQKANIQYSTRNSQYPITKGKGGEEKNLFIVMRAGCSLQGWGDFSCNSEVFF